MKKTLLLIFALILISGCAPKSGGGCMGSSSKKPCSNSYTDYPPIPSFGSSGSASSSNCCNF